jgi:hypothetical protein
VRTSILVLLASACTATWGEPWEGPPSPGAQQPPPPGVDLEGPTNVQLGETHTWTVSGTAIADGDRVDIGWGGAITGGPCPLNAGGECLDIASPARRLASTTVSGGVASFELTVPVTSRDRIYLQALLFDGGDSQRSDALEVSLGRCTVGWEVEMLGNLPFASPAAAVADYDGDGALELFVVGGLFMGDGAGNFTEEGAVRGISHERGAFGLLAADFDGDGDVDVFVPNDGNQGPNRLWVNDGSGVFTDQASVWGLDGTVATAGANAIAWVDLDGDQDLDLYYGGFSGNTSSGPSAARVLRNDGSPPFADITASFPADVGGDSSVWADFDGDGELEGFVSTGNNFIRNRLWDFDGSSWVDAGTAAGVDTQESTRWGNPTAVDLDGDGDLDIHAPALQPSDLAYLSNGDGTFTEVLASTLGLGEVPSFASGAIWQDVDLDGDLDAFLKVEGLYENLGDGTFALAPIQPNLPASQGNATWADMDGDGLADLVVAGGQPQIHFATASAACTPRSFSITGTDGDFPLRAGTVVVDADGDGDFASGVGDRLTTYALGGLAGDTSTPGEPTVIGMGDAPNVDVRVIVRGVATEFLDVTEGTALNVAIP